MLPRKQSKRLVWLRKNWDASYFRANNAKNYFSQYLFFDRNSLAIASTTVKNQTRWWKRSQWSHFLVSEQFRQTLMTIWTITTNKDRLNKCLAQKFTGYNNSLPVFVVTFNDAILTSGKRLLKGSNIIDCTS